jgi:hypothetical protein
MVISEKERADLINALDVLIGAYGRNSDMENRLRDDYAPDRLRGRRARALIHKLTPGQWEVQ